MPCVFVINIYSHLTQTFRKSLCVFVLKYTSQFKANIQKITLCHCDKIYVAI
jgi:hypothetical protein